jgi:hypothetical protein
MKNTICLVVFMILATFLPAVAWAQEETGKTVEVSGEVSCVNNGVAPVPSFSLGKPACVVFVTIGKGPWSYSFDYAADLHGRSWFLDNWAKYTFNHEGQTKFRVGVDVSVFFTPLTVVVNGGEEEEINEGQRYFAFEGALTHAFSEKLSGEAMYWYSRGSEEKRTVRGHFLNLSMTYKTGRLRLTPSVFGISFTDSQGVFAALMMKLHIAGPLWGTAQLIQGISTDIGPLPGLEKSFGFVMEF